jgi:hypothetical protein
MHSRDAEVFPALAASRQRQRVPTYYYIVCHGQRVHIIVDAFFVEPELEKRLSDLYHAYVKWWLAKGNPARRCVRGGLVITRFHDYVGLWVLREHAEWWIELFNQAAVFTYNPWQVKKETPCQTHSSPSVNSTRT